MLCLDALHTSFVVQLESLVEAVESASAQSAAAKAACADLEQRRQQLLNDNAACESAIGDVFHRKEVWLLLMLISVYPCTWVIPKLLRWCPW